MLQYLILALLPAVAGIYFPKREEQKKNRIIFATVLFFGMLILLLSLRHISIGIDNNNYKFYFEKIFRLDFSQITSKFENEHGFYFLNKIVSFISKDYQVFISIVAILSIVPVAIFYGKESDSAYLPLILFMSVAPFSMYFSGLRQALAMAFAIPAFYLAKNRKIIWFVLVCFFAMQFHQSAFMLFFLILICNFRFTSKGILFSSPIILFVYIFNGQIFDFLLRFMGDYEDQYGGEATGAFMMTLLFVLFTVYVFVVIDEEKMIKTDIALRNIMVVALILQIFSAADPIAMRMNYYFLPFIPVLLSRVQGICKEKYIQVVKLANTIFICFFTLYFIYNMLTGEDMLEIYPYKFFWE